MSTLDLQEIWDSIDDLVPDDAGDPMDEGESARVTQTLGYRLGFDTEAVRRFLVLQSSRIADEKIILGLHAVARGLPPVETITAAALLNGFVFGVAYRRRQEELLRDNS